jgi:hypothetical protein
MIKSKVVIFAAIISILFSLCLNASEQRVGEGEVLRPRATEKPPKIDANLDDPAWQSGPVVTGSFITNHPVYGEELPQKTGVYITYDPDNIYFAFHCYDKEPGKIKASITRRDNIFGEDWIGVDLDAMGNRQATYEFYCNPMGIQTDLLNSASGGENAEPDWVWYSAGKVVKDGYIVEMRIPLKSIQFKSGKNVTMTLAFYRYVSRTGANSSWPQISEKKGYFNSLVPIVFEKLDKQLRLEVLPSATYGSIGDRESPQTWAKADNSAEVGVGITYGITSSINAEITVNPDFSQVESDQFQVEANQRYPIFYSEKRPFFMEVNNQFNLAATGGDNNIVTAAHTRNIVDPGWGGKLSGESGKLSFGILAAGDEWPGREWGMDVNPNQGKSATSIIGRLKYGFKGDNYVGLIYSGRQLGDDFNRVVGGDFRCRFPGNHLIALNGLYSVSRSPENPEETRGGAFTLKYDYSRKKLGLMFFMEHFDKDFRMDSAFFFRTGITQFAGYIGPNFYPDKKKLPWLRKINPFIYSFFVHDLHTGMNDFYFQTSVRLSFPKQGQFRLDLRHHKESWAGKTFTRNSYRAIGSIQLTRWLSLSGRLTAGRKLFYDPDDPFVGNSVYYSLDVTLQPNARLTQDFSYIYEHFNRLSDDERIYDLCILVSRTTYQFNKYLFIRGLVQYDSFRKEVLTDLLASFTLIPGTVVHVGYGSLHRKQHWNEEFQNWEQQKGMGRYYQTTRSFFLKVSYLYRF